MSWFPVFCFGGRRKFPGKREHNENAGRFRWAPDGFLVGCCWVTGGFGMGSRCVQGEIKVGLRWVPGRQYYGSPICERSKILASQNFLIDFVTWQRSTLIQMNDQCGQERAWKPGNKEHIIVTDFENASLEHDGPRKTLKGWPDLCPAVPCNQTIPSLPLAFSMHSNARGEIVVIQHMRAGGKYGKIHWIYMKRL